MLCIDLKYSQSARRHHKHLVMNTLAFSEEIEGSQVVIAVSSEPNERFKGFVRFIKGKPMRASTKFVKAIEFKYCFKPNNY